MTEQPMHLLNIGRLALKTFALLWLGLVPVMAAADVSTSVVLTVTTPGTIYFGQNVDGYAQVNSSDGSALTGTITFYDGALNICVIPVATGASCPASTGVGFAAGTHVLTAVYSGDTGHSGSTSNAASVVVLQDSTTASVVSSANPAAYGQSVVFTASIQGAHGIVSGAVTFLDGANMLGSAALNAAGTAAISVSTLGMGTHAITAVYGGTQNSGASTSAVLSEVIQTAPAATITMLASNLDPSVSGQSVIFTANVVKSGQSVTQPTGTVTFLDGGTVLGAGTLDVAGLATFITSSLGVGSHIVTASYAGDAASSGSTSGVLAQVVTSAQGTSPGSFTISAAPVTVRAGQMASVMVKVSPANGFNQAVLMGCTNLPSESACTFGSGMIRAGGGSTTLQLSTMAPRDCGTTTPYSAGLPYAAPMVAGLMMLFIPGKRRRALKGLLMALVALCGLTAMMGCGNCTDLGTRPGTYTINVTGTAAGSTPTVVSQKVTVTVTY